MWIFIPRSLKLQQRRCEKLKSRVPVFVSKTNSVHFVIYVFVTHT